MKFLTFTSNDFTANDPSLYVPASQISAVATGFSDESAVLLGMFSMPGNAAMHYVVRGSQQQVAAEVSRGLGYPLIGIHTDSDDDQLGICLLFVNPSFITAILPAANEERSLLSVMMAPPSGNMHATSIHSRVDMLALISGWQDNKNFGVGYVALENGAIVAKPFKEN